MATAVGTAAQYGSNFTTGTSNDTGDTTTVTPYKSYDGFDLI